jgi:hypothetical protein
MLKLYRVTSHGLDWIMLQLLARTVLKPLDGTIQQALVLYNFPTLGLDNIITFRLDNVATL